MARTPHHPTGATLGRTIATALLASCGLALPACQPARTASTQPTDANFDALRQKRGPVSLIAPVEPHPVDPDTQRRIAESVSMLDAYFAQNESGTPAGGAPKAAYDPSAERGPTGTRHLAMGSPTRSTVEPALLARAGEATAPATTPTTPPTPSTARTNGMTPEQRLLGGFDMVRADEPTTTPRPIVTLASPVFEPNLSWPPVPGGMGIVTADTNPDYTDDLGAAVASANGPLPSIPGVNDPTSRDSLIPGPTGVSTRDGSGMTPEQRKSELVEELVGLLTQVAQTNDDPYQTGLALAGLETLSPGALYELVDSGTLLPNETEILLAAHEFFQGLAADPMQANTENAMTLADQVRERLNETAPLRITAAELCTRVWGYGQYETFDRASDGSYRFMVGRRQPIIIYTEVDRFGRTPTIDADGVAQWKVELSQELQIFHLSDDLLVTARSAETDTSLSRSKMRDYYLINQTYLPETLSLGKYHLKVVMRDANKNAIAEAVIPFQIVASASLDER